MHKKFNEDCTCTSRDILTGRQTDKQTDTLIVVLCCDCVYMSGSAGVQEEASSVAGEDVGWFSEDIDG